MPGSPCRCGCSVRWSHPCRSPPRGGRPCAGRPALCSGTRTWPPPPPLAPPAPTRAWRGAVRWQPRARSPCRADGGSGPVTPDEGIARPKTNYAAWLAAPHQALLGRTLDPALASHDGRECPQPPLGMELLPQGLHGQAEPPRQTVPVAVHPALAVRHRLENTPGVPHLQGRHRLCMNATGHAAPTPTPGRYCHQTSQQIAATSSHFRGVVGLEEHGRCGWA